MDDKIREALGALDWDALGCPNEAQIEAMRTGLGAILPPEDAMRAGMKTGVGNVRRAIAALSTPPAQAEIGELEQARKDLRALRDQYNSMLTMARALYENAKQKPGGFTAADGVFIVEHSMAALSAVCAAIDRERPEIAVSGG